MEYIYEYISHSGKGHDDNPPGRGSGRYPYGSGARPFQDAKIGRNTKKNARSRNYIINDVIKQSDNIPINRNTILMSFGSTPEARQIVITELKRRGYNAMVDEAGVKVFNKQIEGIDPLILFDGGNQLRENSIREINQEEQIRNGRIYDNWYNKVNRKDRDW